MIDEVSVFVRVWDMVDVSVTVEDRVNVCDCDPVCVVVRIWVAVAVPEEDTV